jgi:hypothetical protein
VEISCVAGVAVLAASVGGPGDVGCRSAITEWYTSHLGSVKAFEFTKNNELFLFLEVFHCNSALYATEICVL